jgi:aspartate racemase
MRRKVIGILGGMGPEATVDLFWKIIKATPAKTDQEHLHIIVDCYPQIPGRPQAILGKGESPVALMRATAQNLERAGADFLVIACNSAHYFYMEITGAVSIPVLHIIKEVSNRIERDYSHLTRIGLLGGMATVTMGLYESELEPKGFRVIAPEDREQEQVVEAIYTLKARGNLGKAKEKLLWVIERLRERGAQSFIAGCTEIPLILSGTDIDEPLIDATNILAEAAVAYAIGERNNVGYR